MMKAGPFDISRELAAQMLAAPLNPNGRPNSDVVKLRLGGQDVTQGNRETWIIDFGVDTPIETASLYEIPFEYVRSNVKPERDSNRNKRLREMWWIHGAPRPGLRDAIRKLQRCIVTPEVSKHRVFVWMSTHVIPDHKLHVFARDDDYFFGVLHSRTHEIWSLAQCSWMGVGNDPSYSSSRTFGTFPFPWPPGREPMRDAWLHAAGLSDAEKKKRTLTGLYNARPTWLGLAHRKLDAAVAAAYGWPADLPDDDILARLLALNHARAGKG